jgi:hypothetical protein
MHATAKDDNWTSMQTSIEPREMSLGAFFACELRILPGKPIQQVLRQVSELSVFSNSGKILFKSTHELLNVRRVICLCPKRISVHLRKGCLRKLTLILLN